MSGDHKRQEAVYATYVPCPFFAVVSFLLTNSPPRTRFRRTGAPAEGAYADLSGDHRRQDDTYRTGGAPVPPPRTSSGSTLPRAAALADPGLGATLPRGLVRPAPPPEGTGTMTDAGGMLLSVEDSVSPAITRPESEAMLQRAGWREGSFVVRRSQTHPDW